MFELTPLSVLMIYVSQGVSSRVANLAHHVSPSHMVFVEGTIHKAHNVSHANKADLCEPKANGILSTIAAEFIFEFNFKLNEMLTKNSLVKLAFQSLIDFYVLENRKTLFASQRQIVYSAR